ncbi:hypothetical protein SEA_ARCHIMEDES_40 [Gordonia phage Archimedes]|uniref:Uncharacterized protein n=1 Tax=Gordonia phage Archimedes TaxID=2759389 RepID=A0A7L7SI09_9CAUD|nr:hypothetical protein KCH38_gp40 [Gordonia phage Archimedes]QOC55740.1 hypothetical protein SEA_ARCHIMEDES_40 [Gordonia phage Archimedes]
MQISQRTGGPREPGTFPIIDLQYELGVGGPIQVAHKQIFLRAEHGLLFLFPTDPDVPDREWFVNIDRIVKADYVATVSFDSGDFS